MRIKWKDLFFDHLSYKVVALFIAIILWVTILGRRDFVLQKNVEVEVQTSTSMTLKSQSVDFIKVKVSGPRAALKKFVDSGVSQLLTIDLSQKTEGSFDVEIPLHRIDVPFGVKIVSIRPSRLQVKIVKRMDSEGKNE